MSEQSEEFIKRMPIEIVIDLLSYIGYEVQAIERDSETRYLVIDRIPDPVVTQAMSDQALRALLIEQLRESDDSQAQSE